MTSIDWKIRCTIHKSYAIIFITIDSYLAGIRIWTPLLRHHQDLKSIQFNTFYSNKCSFISNYRLSIFCIHVSLYYTTVYCFVNYSYCKPSLQMMLYNIIYLHFWRFKLDFFIGVQNLKTIKSHFTLIPNFLVYILFITFSCI